MNKKTFFILSLLSTIYIIGNIIWYQINKPIFILQPESALYFFDVLDNKLFSQIHPPLLSLIIKSLLYIFGTHNFIIIYMSLNIFFFILSLFFIFKIGEQINGITCGQISMILLAATPAIYGLSRFYGRQDFHIIPILLMGVYSLIQSDMFKNQKWTILYAISIGLGLLLRETFLGFAIPFFLFFMLMVISKKIKKQQIYNLIIMTIISFVLYSLQFTQKLKFSLLYTPFMEQKVSETFFTKINIILGGISENILALPLFLLMIFSIIFIFTEKKYKNYIILMLLCGLTIPIIIALLIPHYKQQVYMVPLVPTIILLIATSISYLNVNIRKILLILFIVVSILQYTELSYGYKTWICDWKIKIRNNFYFKYFNKYDENIIFYDSVKKNNYIKVLSNMKIFENKKILVLADNYEGCPYMLQTLRSFLLANGFNNIIVNSSVLNLYLPTYSRELINYDLIIDLRTNKNFVSEYFYVSQNINEHKFLNNFHIPTKDDFYNKYNSFWNMYTQTKKYEINFTSAIVYELKK